MLSTALYWVTWPLVRAYASLMLQLDVVHHTALPKGAKVVVANHPSVSDPFVMALILGQPVVILIKDEVFTIPVVGPYLRHSGHVPVIHGRGKEAFDTGVAALRSGQTVLLYPEGEISPGEGAFHPARTGAVRMGLATGAPVVPVGIHLRFDRIKTFTARIDGRLVDEYWYLRGPYAMTFGEPLYLRGSLDDRSHVEACSQAVMLRIQDLADHSARRLTGRPLQTQPRRVRAAQG